MFYHLILYNILSYAIVCYVCLFVCYGGGWGMVMMVGSLVTMAVVMVRAMGDRGHNEDNSFLICIPCTHQSTDHGDHGAYDDVDIDGGDDDDGGHHGNGDGGGSPIVYSLVSQSPLIIVIAIIGIIAISTPTSDAIDPTTIAIIIMITTTTIISTMLIMSRV